MESTGTEAVKQQINAEFERRKKSVYGLRLLCWELFSGIFRQAAEGNTYWENRTILRRIRFSVAFKEGEGCTWFFLAHTVQYGVYLSWRMTGRMRLEDR